MHQSYQVKLDTFEGPLDLLLHLINQYEIDIYDIPVAKITEQYMDYIHTMQYLELNVASDYLVMASTLLVLKSQMLLPKQEIDESDEAYMEDPREELMQRLIEYRKYKDAAKNLEDKEMEANQVFSRSPVFLEYPETKPPAVKGDISVYEMIDALGKMFERKKWHEPLETRVKSSEIPIEQRMTEVLDKVKYSSSGIAFDELFEYPSKSHIVVTFMAILELMKNNEVMCIQKNHFEQLYVLFMEDKRGNE
ncbi:segregation/condensation protein A [Lentibacillus amyloliquefaciens]|uniref:Segregation and condensation protein A n=1 Tax=Lentibacillus amyloliquefaciens TaxID=1472767 RepID=A0A0U4G5P4_9BACI|nr:segregation/condensation protein A [Lentibacillus amyloliquefaciens]ALX47994.1 segregation and condensation protein A [Lentibacillus amyloliquefaciens]